MSITKTGLRFISVTILLPEVMDMLALESLRFNVDGGVDFTAGDHGQVSFNVKGEGTETLDVDTLASPEVVVKVSHKGSPNNQHLKRQILVYLPGLWLQLAFEW